MVKVRLWGKKDEIDKLAAFLEEQSGLLILNQSGGYIDRGKSVYERVYLDVELLEVKTDD